jgi:menaquinone-dependent protoporphyrinogen oxidase
MTMTSKQLSRRDFLKLSGLALGGAALTCSGLGYAATRTPDIATPEFLFAKDTTMTQKILVTYATRAGSTAEIAAAIGQTLAERGFNAEVKPVKKVSSLAGYQSVILGSAIRMGNWLPEMVKFVQDNQLVLNGLPTALFTAHMLNTDDDEASCVAREAYTAPVRALLPKAPEALFSGVMDFSRLSFLDRFIANMVKVVESDQRDWEKIRTWANTVLN